jgi:hypothetical protein
MAATAAAKLPLAMVERMVIETLLLCRAGRGAGMRRAPADEAAKLIFLAKMDRPT